MENLLILVVFVALSGLSSWLQKRGRHPDSPPGAPPGPRPPLLLPAPPGAGTARHDLLTITQARPECSHARRAPRPSAPTAPNLALPRSQLPALPCPMLPGPRLQLPGARTSCFLSMTRIWSRELMVGDSPPCTQKMRPSIRADRLRAAGGEGGGRLPSPGSRTRGAAAGSGAAGSAPVYHHTHPPGPGCCRRR